jgi:hypothetical protein
VSEVTPESLRTIQANINKSRRSLSRCMADIEKLEKEIDIYENTVILNFVFKRNNLELKGKNEPTRQAEIKEYLLEDINYTLKQEELEELKSKKRDLNLDVEKLELDLRISMALFENERSKANREVLNRFIDSKLNISPEISAITQEISHKPLSKFFSDDLDSI